MTKKITFLSIAALMSAAGFADTLSPQQALERASNSFEGKKMVNATVKSELAYTVKDATGAPAVYVFNKANNGGTLILAADDVAMPVLGYTDEGTFDAATMPDVVRYWLGEYAREIEYAKANGYSTVAKRSVRQAYPSDWTNVAPLMKTQWNQDAPYNLETPVVGGQHTPTGCVATATAQVMKYWNWPEIGEGGIRYAGTTGALEMYFDQQPFEWDKMLDKYVPGQYTEEEANAVAYLMKACGFSSQMQYSSWGSGTPTSLAGIALFKYFKYDGNIKRALRCTMTDAEWAAIIYNQLKTVGPVLYDGDSPNGGHAFVVDGYDQEGFFHLNWGWGGTSNGYYLLTALNPTSQGTGGSYGGFNTDQGIIYDIQKPTGQPVVEPEPEIMLYGSLSATSSSNTLTFSVTGWNYPGFANLSLADAYFNFGIEISPANGGGETNYVLCTLPSAQRLGTGNLIMNSTHPVARIPSTLADGKYKVRLVWRSTNSTTYKHFGVPIGNYDYVYVTKEGNSYTVENLDRLHLVLESASILTPLYYNSPCLVRYTLKNDTDMELTQMVRPRLLFDGKVNYLGDTQLVTLAPKSTVTKDIETTFYREDGGKVPSTTSTVDFTLGVYDFNADMDYGTFGTYTMRRSGSNTKVIVKNFEIANGQKGENVGGTPFYGVDNFYAIDVAVGIEVSGVNAFLASPLIAAIYEYGSTEPEMEQEFSGYVYLASGDSAEKHTLIQFPNFDVTKTYTLTVYYINGGARVALDSLMFGAGAGVGEIADETGALELNFYGNEIKATSANGLATVAVYSADGMKLAEKAANGETTVAIPCDSLNGILIVKAIDKTGNEKTIKVRK